MQPNAPNPNYDFILKDPKPPKKGFSLPALNLSSLNSRLGLAGLGVMVLILFSVLVFGHKSSANQPLVNAVGQAQEINRVSALVIQQAKDVDTKNLAVSVQTVLISQEQQIVGYLKTKGTKVDPAKQTAYKNSGTDAQLQQATQAGNLGSVYKSYLKTSLGAYQTAISTAYRAATPGSKSLLQNAYLSNQTVLSSI